MRLNTGKIQILLEKIHNKKILFSLNPTPACIKTRPDFTSHILGMHSCKIVKADPRTALILNTLENKNKKITREQKITEIEQNWIKFKK